MANNKIRITGCYILKEDMELIRKKVVKKDGQIYFFSPYIETLIQKGLEEKLFGVYMLEPGVTKNFDADAKSSPYKKCTVDVDSSIIEKLSVLFEDKWNKHFTSFPIRPYLYWLIRRDLTGAEDSVFRYTKSPSTPIYQQRCNEKYLQRHVRIYFTLRRDEYDKIIEIYGKALNLENSLTPYAKYLFSKGIERSDFGVSVTPQRGENQVRKATFIDVDIVNVMEETFRGVWEDKYKKFPYSKYLYYLMQKDLSDK